MANATVGNLSAEHIGQTIVIETGGPVIRGRLQSVNHACDEYDFVGRPVAPTLTSLELDGATSLQRILANTPCKIEGDGQ